jgi:hypothetical protein
MKLHPEVVRVMAVSMVIEEPEALALTTLRVWLPKMMTSPTTRGSNPVPESVVTVVEEPTVETVPVPLMKAGPPTQ